MILYFLVRMAVKLYCNVTYIIPSNLQSLEVSNLLTTKYVRVREYTSTQFRENSTSSHLLSNSKLMPNDKTIKQGVIDLVIFVLDTSQSSEEKFLGKLSPEFKNSNDSFSTRNFHLNSKMNTKWHHHFLFTKWQGLVQRLCNYMLNVLIHMSILHPNHSHFLEEQGTGICQALTIVVPQMQWSSISEVHLF